MESGDEKRCRVGTLPESAPDSRCKFWGQSPSVCQGTLDDEADKGQFFTGPEEIEEPAPCGEAYQKPNLLCPWF
ncbi:hypothetical protein DPMN_121002 [Dreissena polymorpha]|uniref:Uncharacterized protein n=1 Tax=Dreissena polymorpha TaxID=45954 RepID=A0A9D4GPD9_DREPO|nr:hypothetical protein DPMN_121002 [Dreissena polymorpha]